MFSVLLAVIYLTFISLGLPDALLGAAWPSMRLMLDVPVSFAGILSAIISGGTVLSSLLSGKLLRRFSTGTVSACSVLLTAGALLGFSLSDRFSLLCLFAVPYGLGAGAVDAALNLYVTLHFPARHMNWLYCFWGIGAAAGPYIISYAIAHGQSGWRSGYRAVGIIQLLLTAILFLSLPLWKRNAAAEDSAVPEERGDSMKNLLRQKRVLRVLLTFFCYCVLESTAGLWTGSFLQQARGFRAELAAGCTAFFYIGIMLGRLLSGCLTERFGDQRMIRAGLSLVAGAVALLMLPAGLLTVSAGLLMLGLGAAPIYPSLIHATPKLCGTAQTQMLIGLQTASAYLGSSLMPPLFGLLSGYIGIGSLPVYLAGCTLMLAMLTAPDNKKRSG